MQRSQLSPSRGTPGGVDANQVGAPSGPIRRSFGHDVEVLDRAPLLAAAALTALAYLSAAPALVTASLLGFVAATFDDARRSRAGGLVGALSAAALAVLLDAVMDWRIDRSTIGGVALAVATSRLATSSRVPATSSPVTTAAALAIAALCVPATTPGWWSLAAILIGFDTARAGFRAESGRVARLISSALLVAGFGATFELLGVADLPIAEPPSPTAGPAMLVVAAGATLAATAARRLQR